MHDLSRRQNSLVCKVTLSRISNAREIIDYESVWKDQN